MVRARVGKRTPWVIPHHNPHGCGYCRGNRGSPSKLQQNRKRNTQKRKKNRERMRERELVVGRSKSATPCNSTHSRDTWHVGVASGSISSWFLKFCDSSRGSIGAYNAVYNARDPASTRDASLSIDRVCSTTVTPANSRKGQSRFVGKRVRSPETIFKAGTSRTFWTRHSKENVG